MTVESWQSRGNRQGARNGEGAELTHVRQNSLFLLLLSAFHVSWSKIALKLTLKFDKSEREAKEAKTGGEGGASTCTAKFTFSAASVAFICFWSEVCWKRTLKVDKSGSAESVVKKSWIGAELMLVLSMTHPPNTPGKYCCFVVYLSSPTVCTIGWSHLWSLICSFLLVFAIASVQ